MNLYASKQTNKSRISRYFNAVVYNHQGNTYNTKKKNLSDKKQQQMRYKRPLNKRHPPVQTNRHTHTTKANTALVSSTSGNNHYFNCWTKVNKRRSKELKDRRRRKRKLELSKGMVGDKRDGGDNSFVCYQERWRELSLCLVQRKMR